MIARSVIVAVGRHPSAREVRFVGSRADGRATDRSDWDFVVDTDEFDTVAADLPVLCAPLEPVAQQWDRLSSSYCWMLILRGPTKVDLIFADQPHQPVPPRVPTVDNLAAIDHHFWDWMLWLNGKSAADNEDLVTSELKKLHVHLLAGLGVTQTPASISAAVVAYRDARTRAERRFGCRVPPDLETEVAPTLTRATRQVNDEAAD
jgi:hypothetical protein